MTRYVQPAWLFGETTRIDWASLNKGLNLPVSGDDLRPMQLLRWALHPDIGLPTAPFTIWTRPESPKADPPTTAVGLPVTAVTPSASRDIALTAAAWRVTLVVDTPSGSLTINGYDGAGSRICGTTIDTGAAGQSVSLTGSGIVRVRATGSGTIHSAGFVSVSAYANLPDWQPLEIVGLPVGDDAGSAGPYPAGPQGMASPTLSPTAAAIDRLRRAAPRLGWPAPATGSGPVWAAPDPTVLVKTYQSTLVADLITMLTGAPDPTSHAAYRISSDLADPQDQRNPETTTNTLGTSTASVPPLGLLSLACHGDPYAAISLGFATAYPTPQPVLTHVVPPTDFMVSVPHTFTLRAGKARQPFAGELAAFFAPVAPARPAAPAHLGGTLGLGGPRPGGRDEPRISSVAVSWDRPQTSAGSMEAVSDVVARTPPIGSPNLLVPVRPNAAAVPFVPAQPTNPTPAQAARVTFADGVFPDPAQPTGDYTYLVCGQNRWGLWSEWSIATMTPPADTPQQPLLVAVGLDLTDAAETGSSRSALLRLDLSWDWHDRTPATIEVAAEFVAVATAPPAVPPTLAFVPTGSAGPLVVSWASGTEDTPTASLPDTTITRSEPAQAKDDTTPPDDVGRYRIDLPVTLDFSSGNDLRLACWIRGTERFSGLTSDWTSARSAQLSNPIPPVAPGPPGPVTWAALPDALGVSRAHLVWTADTTIQYVVYHADENALLALAGHPAPDLTMLPTARAAALDAVVRVENVRDAFLRVNADPISGGSYEVELPRGSELLHGFVVLGRSAAGVESEWPTTPPVTVGGRGYTLMGIPRINAPRPPALSASANGGASVTVHVAPTAADAVARVDIHRTALARLASDVGSMGPAITSLTPTSDGSVDYSDPVTPAWRPYVYRAVAWGATDDANGLRTAASAASKPQAVLVVPTTPPSVTGAALVAAVSAVPSYVRFTTDAPPIVTQRGRFPLQVTFTYVDSFGNPNQSTLRTTLDALPSLTAEPTNADTAFIRADAIGVVVPPEASATLHQVQIVLTDPLGRAQEPVEIEVS
jgi:hypothetical protein